MATAELVRVQDGDKTKCYPGKTSARKTHHQPPGARVGNESNSNDLKKKLNSKHKNPNTTGIASCMKLQHRID